MAEIKFNVNNMISLKDQLSDIISNYYQSAEELVNIYRNENPGILLDSTGMDRVNTGARYDSSSNSYTWDYNGNGDTVRDFNDLGTVGISFENLHNALYQELSNLKQLVILKLRITQILILHLQ